MEGYSYVPVYLMAGGLYGYPQLVYIASRF